jgi:hypothetical protein
VAPPTVVDRGVHLFWGELWVICGDLKNVSGFGVVLSRIGRWSTAPDGPTYAPSGFVEVDHAGTPKSAVG